jgi:hypothetical protein
VPAASAASVRAGRVASGRRGELPAGPFHAPAHRSGAVRLRDPLGTALVCPRRAQAACARARVRRPAAGTDCATSDAAAARARHSCQRCAGNLNLPLTRTDNSDPGPDPDRTRTALGTSSLGQARLRYESDPSPIRVRSESDSDPGPGIDGGSRAADPAQRFDSGWHGWCSALGSGSARLACPLDKPVPPSVRHYSPA